MDLLPLQADDVHQQALGDAVLAHHPCRQLPTTLGELQVAVVRDLQQAVALHPRHRLAHGGAALLQPLRDPGAHGDDALLLEFEDGAQVHLSRIDQVTAHRRGLRSSSSSVVADPILTHPADNPAVRPFGGC